jgi:CRP-like cAMP-binding protein
MASVRIHNDQRVELLRGVSLFSGCSKDELRRIASLTTEHRVKAREVLAERGQPGLEFFVIVEGTATASRGGVHLATLGPGSFFGELALLDGGERTASVVADSDMRVLVLSRKEFQGLHSVAPSVAYKMLAEVGRRLRQADELLDEAAESQTVGVRGAL